MLLYYLFIDIVKHKHYNTQRKEWYYDKDLKANKKALKAIQNVEEGKNLSRKFSSVAELMEDLNAWYPIRKKLIDRTRLAFNL